MTDIVEHNLLPAERKIGAIIEREDKNDFTKIFTALLILYFGEKAVPEKVVVLKGIISHILEFYPGWTIEILADCFKCYAVTAERPERLHGPFSIVKISAVLRHCRKYYYPNGQPIKSWRPAKQKV